MTRRHLFAQLRLLQIELAFNAVESFIVDVTPPIEIENTAALSLQRTFLQLEFMFVTAGGSSGFFMLLHIMEPFDAVFIVSHEVFGCGSGRTNGIQRSLGRGHSHPQFISSRVLSLFLGFGLKAKESNDKRERGPLHKQGSGDRTCRQEENENPGSRGVRHRKRRSERDAATHSGPGYERDTPVRGRIILMAHGLSDGRA